MSYHLRVKICGITSAQDAKLAARLGADAVGLNFAPQSPRFITPIDAETILRALPPWVEPVGIFVNRPLRETFQFANDLGRLRAIQWHGDQRELSDAFPFQLIQAFAVRDRNSMLEIDRYLSASRDLGQLPSALLLDGFAPNQYGGTGKTAPWDLIADYRPDDVPIILAGGLKPENVADAVRIVRPYGVDVAGGVEMSPGKKDPAKLAQFIYNARLAASQLKQ